MESNVTICEICNNTGLIKDDNPFKVCGCLHGGRVLKEKILDCQSRIRSAEAEMQGWRTHCTHPSYYVGLWSWRVGSIHPKRICDICGVPVGEPTDKEMVGAGLDRWMESGIIAGSTIVTCPHEEEDE